MTEKSRLDPAGIRELSLLQNIKDGSTSYSMRTEEKSLGLKADSSFSFCARLKLNCLLIYTVRSESRCALSLRYVDLVVSFEVAVEVCCCFTVFIC
jgi:hypothetical protein